MANYPTVNGTRITPKSQSRFWSSVDVAGRDECWIWQAATTGSGYGRMRIEGEGHVNAHRISAGLDGRDPNAEFVLHKCHNPPCVNPSHLYLGSHADNMKDMVDVGNHNTQVLSKEDVICIIRKLRTGEKTYVELAEEYGVLNTTISNIKNGHTWTWVDERPESVSDSGIEFMEEQLPDDEKREKIRQELSEDWRKVTSGGEP